MRGLATLKREEPDVPEARAHVPGERWAARVNQEHRAKLLHPLVVRIAEDDDFAGRTPHEVAAEVLQVALRVGVVERAGAIRPLKLVDERDCVPFELQHMVVFDARVGFEALIVVAQRGVDGRNPLKVRSEERRVGKECRL